MLKMISLLLLVFFHALTLFGQPYSEALSIIPEPVSVLRSRGSYQLPKDLVIQVRADQPEVRQIAHLFLQRVGRATGYKGRVSQVSAVSGQGIRFSLVQNEWKTLGAEGYRLHITGSGIALVAAQPAGLFYGVQTLFQLLPPEVESPHCIAGASWFLPFVRVEDFPRFAWRGLMLDVARHFFNKEQVKQFIDEMVKYKYNLLHLHLTDDDGWRLEIKSFPKLTQIGAWRPNKIGTYTFFPHPAASDPNDYGGFFTQEDIREIVRYAQLNYVQVLPEIDVPGHSLAAIAAYGGLACTPGNYRPCSGDTVMVWPKDEAFYAVYDNSLCAAKEEVYDFLDKVFEEVAALFPFAYIHTGGDENAKNFWAQSAAIQELMKRENIASVDGVQNYFSRRVEKIIASKGKKMIGWDEVVEGELEPGTAIMSWRGLETGVTAAQKKHEVVFSPTTYAYLNYMQGDPALEPPVHSSQLLKSVYEAEPFPASLDLRYVKGIQGNLWTEQVYTFRHLQYMLWPRAFAIAEHAWSSGSSKDWPRFVQKVEAQFKRYSFSGTNYCPSLYDPIINAETKGSDLLVRMTMQLEDLDLHYSFDNSYPDAYYPKYKGVLLVPKDASLLRVISYQKGKPKGRMLSIAVAALRQRGS